VVSTDPEPQYSPAMKNAARFPPGAFVVKVTPWPFSTTMSSAVRVIIEADAGAANPTDIATAMVVAARTTDFNLFTSMGKPFLKRYFKWLVSRIL
jgi:hypothetical protein